MAALAAPPSSTPATQNGKAPAVVNPFTKASGKRTETFFDVVQAMGAASVGLQQIDVPATGYLRHVWLYVSLSGYTAATYAADGPWNVFDSVQLADVNGQPILLLSGYELFLANLFGGYTQHADARKHSSYSSSATAATFALRVPVEIIQRHALGALENMNAAMTYKLKLTIAPQATVFTAITGTASVEVTGLVESWSNPPAADLHGVPNEVRPPSLGATQNWTTEVKAVNAGAQTPRFSRVGNQIRNHILVARDNTGARSAAVLPTTISIFKDGNQQHKAPQSYFIQRVCELYGYAPADIPAGVLPLPYTDDFDGTPGEEQGDYWLQTSGATRLELQGSFGAAGNLGITTNDILASVATGGAGATLGAQAA